VHGAMRSLSWDVLCKLFRNKEDLD
jgi:hypothetical protein